MFPPVAPPGRRTLRGLLYPEPSPRRRQQDEASLRGLALQQSGPREPVRDRPQLQGVHRGMCPAARRLDRTRLVRLPVTARGEDRPRSTLQGHVLLRACLALSGAVVQSSQTTLGQFCWLYFGSESSLDSTAFAGLSRSLSVTCQALIS